MRTAVSCCCCCCVLAVVPSCWLLRRPAATQGQPPGIKVGLLLLLLQDSVVFSERLVVQGSLQGDVQHMQARSGAVVWVEGQPVCLCAGECCCAMKGAGMLW